jgi:hypothetical protein
VLKKNLGGRKYKDGREVKAVDLIAVNTWPDIKRKGKSSAH